MHRVTAIEDTTILEVSTPQLDDVVRLEDAYGRAGTSAPYANLDTTCGKVGACTELLTVGAAAAETGWSARMLRYLERARARRPAPHAVRLPALRARELNRSLARASCARAFGVELAELAFARGCGASRELRAAVDGWLAAGDDAGSWVEWEQRKHERLLAA